MRHMMNVPAVLTPKHRMLVEGVVVREIRSPVRQGGGGGQKKYIFEGTGI